MRGRVGWDHNNADTLHRLQVGSPVALFVHARAHTPQPQHVGLHICCGCHDASPLSLPRAFAVSAPCGTTRCGCVGFLSSRLNSVWHNAVQMRGPVAVCRANVCNVAQYCADVWSCCSPNVRHLPCPLQQLHDQSAARLHHHIRHRRGMPLHTGCGCDWPAVCIDDGSGCDWPADMCVPRTSSRSLSIPYSTPVSLCALCALVPTHHAHHNHALCCIVRIVCIVRVCPICCTARYMAAKVFSSSLPWPSSWWRCLAVPAWA